MPIKIYNSLTREKEEFKPLKDGEVKIYTCGVTVYDECHIGHARSLYIFDVIRRYFEYRGYKVKFIRNITDIDDKIINKAKELGKTAKEVAQDYIKSYRKDLKTLGIDEADKEPCATEHIKEMIKHIEGLIKKDYAYVVDGDVYFSVKKFKDYGKLSGQSTEQMLEAVRIEKDPKKKDPLDFALWKKSQEDEPFWESPWGKGRPGWHIECSVMSSKYLGETFDIHAGGRDLIFPHHENEIAQSQALYGENSFARYWIHHGLLTINGQKMAKSLGNFVTISQFLEKYEADILKLFFLTAHYRSPIDYTEEKIEIAKKNKAEIDRLFSQHLFGKIDKSDKKDKQEIDKIIENSESAMSDDFNTPRALAEIFKVVNLSSSYITQDKISALDYSRKELIELLRIFGISVKNQIDAKTKIKLKKLLQERQEARKDKDFKRADEIREEIKKTGFIISDTGSGFSVTKK